MLTPSLFERAIHDQSLRREDVEALGAGPHRLVDCDMSGADLSDLEMADWTFERCDLREANFSSAQFERAKSLSCRAGFSRWGRSDLAGALFQSCDANNADFRSCYVANLRFVGCKLTGANLTDGRGLGWSFEEVLLIGANVSGQSFRKAALNRVDFTQADLSKCDFRGAVLQECRLREARLDRALFDGADLRGADLGGLRVQDLGPFRGATFSADQASDLLAGFGIELG